MTPFTLQNWALPLAAAFLLCALPAFAQDQGTPEQREACAPDAVRLCQDTIPDVDRTTACMARHRAELTPRCRAVFSAATETPEAREPRPRRAAGVAPGQEDDDAALGPRRYEYLTPDGEPAESGRRVAAPAPDEDRARARAEIRQACEDEEIDQRTCDLTRRAFGER